MSSQIATGAWLLLVVFMHGANGQTSTTNINVTSTKDVLVTADPVTMQTGFTKYLTVNCTFVSIDQSSFHTLSSLILSKRENYYEDFHEVATINSNSRDQLQNVHSMGADHVEGHINIDAVSFITFKWRYPSSQVQGTYQCVAYGLDNTGRPMHSSSEVEVIEQEADFHMYLDKMKQMDDDLDQCKKSQSDMEKKLQDLTAHLNRIQNRLDSSMASNAVASKSWNGHNYYVSDREWQNSRVFSSRCNLYGGYLAEINSDAEYHMVYNWLHGEMAINDFVALGATDEGHEGRWTWMRSGKPMDYINWTGSEPTGVGQDCLFISRGWHGLIDDYCVYHQRFARFLCEVDH